MSFSKSFAAFDTRRVIERATKLRNDAKIKINETITFHINREIDKSKFWNKWTLGLIKVKTPKDFNGKDIYRHLSMTEGWFYSDLISNRNYYANILRLAIQSNGDVVYLTSDDAKIFVGE